MPTAEYSLRNGLLHGNQFARSLGTRKEQGDRTKERSPPGKTTPLHRKMLYAQSRSVKANTGRDAGENIPIEEAAAKLFSGCVV